jgi:hypothetical protein
MSSVHKSSKLNMSLRAVLPVKSGVASLSLRSSSQRQEYYKINRPPHLRWAIGLTCSICLLARLRPTIRQIVIVIIVIIIGEVHSRFHDGGIIAQSFLRVAIEPAFLVHFCQPSQAGASHD